MFTIGDILEAKLRLEVTGVKPYGLIISNESWGKLIGGIPDGMLVKSEKYTEGLCGLMALPFGNVHGFLVVDKATYDHLLDGLRKNMYV